MTLVQKPAKTNVVFLGGTTGNDYRERLTAALVERGVSIGSIFNPVVEHWNEEAQQKEDRMKKDSSVLMLFYLSGNEDGIFLSFYSLHEAEMGLYDEPHRTSILFDYSGLVSRAAKRLQKVYFDLKKRFPEAPLFESMADAEEWLVQNLG